jgi:AraC-like DNA-binding protein/mannose-6-phosphate isomerase-like protein (cupin superfamily)
MSLPEPTPTTRARREYSPYRSTLSPEFAAIFEELRVRRVTAIYYECFANYEMLPRRIGDDMFYYIVKGRGEVLVEDRLTKIAPGEVAHFARGVLHAAYTDRRDPFHVIALHYDARVHESLTLPQLLQFPDVVNAGLDSPFYEMLSVACREFALRPPGWERGLDALGLRLLLNYVREYVGAQQLNYQLRWRELHRVLPALELMRSNISRVITIGELASACHLSQPHFRRIFTRVLGAAPNDYLRRLRLEEAAQLLRRTNETVDAVAARVGYSDPSYFAQSFKAVMGMPPGKYRCLPSV